MTRRQLVEQIFQKQSYLCVGLDTDLAKIPKHLLSEPDPVFEFNKQIIDATKDFCVAYKINTAFYEAMGVRGWEAMEKTVYYIGEGHFRIADAKRGDIGNTSDQYAKAFFEALHFDAVTVTPYMGKDSVLPFLEYKDKWAIILGLTSNNGSRDFQKLYLQADEQLSELWNFYKESALIKPEQVQLYEKVLVSVSLWGTRENTMFVIGATQADDFINIRKIIPDHFLLVPGVGVQGGSLKEISEKAMISDCGLLVNVSRAIIYASGDNDFNVKARQAAKAYQTEMNDFLKK